MLLSGSGQWCPVGLPFKDVEAKAKDAHGVKRQMLYGIVFWQWLNLLRLIIIAVMVLVSCLMLSSS